MCEFILSRPHLFIGKRVIDLGSGMGTLFYPIPIALPHRIRAKCMYVP